MRGGRRTIAAAAVGVVAALLVATACGSGDSSTDNEEASEDADTVTVVARDLEFVPDELSIRSGEAVLLRLTNEGSLEHDLEVADMAFERLDDGGSDDGHGGDHDSLLALHTDAGETAELMFQTNEEGTFVFYCTIPGHRDEGMVGMLTVE